MATNDYGARSPHFSDSFLIANGANLSSTGGVNNSGVLDMRQVTSLLVYIPASFSGNVGFKISHAVDGTFSALYDETNTLVSITAGTQRWHYVPTKLFPAHYVKFWSQTSGSDTNQSADRTLIVMGKA